MAVYRPDILPHVAQLIRHLPPELKRSVKQVIRSLSSNPFSGEPLLRELTGLWKYKVRRFRLIYEVDRKARLIRIFALGHRREVYEELADRLREARRRKRVAQRNKVESQQARPARHEANDAPFADDQVLHHASELAGC
jgi:mRNA interferase RelE/StbE